MVDLDPGVFPHGLPSTFARNRLGAEAKATRRPKRIVNQGEFTFVHLIEISTNDGHMSIMDNYPPGKVSPCDTAAPYPNTRASAS
ncbi:MAG: hypothetical protein BroJett006_21280 [Betaproteobacteria bacterium]|nr:MAG: hypothetical protein BroJett006_21280 [Betaproteobacteria bacterium]